MYYHYRRKQFGNLKMYDHIDVRTFGCDFQWAIIDELIIDPFTNKVVVAKTHADKKGTPLEVVLPLDYSVRVRTKRRQHRN